MRRNEHIHCADGEAFPLQSGPDPTIGFGRISVKKGEIEGRNELFESLSVSPGLCALWQRRIPIQPE
jgi:hypothetical protein